MNPIAPLTAAPKGNSREDLAKAAQGFEAIFVRQMLSAARKADFGGADLLGGEGMDTFRQMQDERFADIAAERGAFGLAKVIEAQLARQVGSNVSAGASTSSARAGLGKTPDHAQPEPVKDPAQLKTAGA